MEFNSNKAIYLQICDSICEQILGGTLKPDARILSVREYGSEIGVNPNTVMRSYEKLTNEGIIYNKRGIGYFIAPDAKKKVLEQQRQAFLEKELPQILKRMKLLGIDASMLSGIKVD
ncbi:MAG: GntR family transcriptional regulator [Bacteroidales bacterium]|nr:GntR family transcriptional regulator [Bacteroides sp.]MCM1501613.1 GntR family transcriptional regulator [Bacteroidales bacterium]